MASLVGLVMEIVGSVVSVIEYVTVIVSCPMFPATSWALTVMTLAPSVSVMLAILHEVVPVAVPLPPVSHSHVTLVTPTVSDAVPAIVVIGLVSVD